MVALAQCDHPNQGGERVDHCPWAVRVTARSPSVFVVEPFLCLLNPGKSVRLRMDGASSMCLGVGGY